MTVHDDADDAALLGRWRAGDKAAGSTLVNRHHAAVYRFFSTKLSDGVPDLVQRTFVACVEGRDALRDDASFRGYLFGVARRQLYLHLRSRYRGNKVFAPAEMSAETFGSLDPSPTGIIADRDEKRLLLKGLRRIPLDLQITVELFYWDELSLRDVADALEIPTGTVKSRLNRARDALRRELQQLESSDELRKSTVDNLERWARSMRAKLD